MEPLASCFSAASAFILKPETMKNAVEPTTAPKAISGSRSMVNQTIRSSTSEATA